MNPINITGCRYGRLTVDSIYGSDKRGAAEWLCICACGNTAVVKGWNLRAGKTRSCGCLHSEQVEQMNQMRKRA